MRCIALLLFVLAPAGLAAQGFDVVPGPAEQALTARPQTAEPYRFEMMAGPNDANLTRFVIEARPTELGPEVDWWRTRVEFEAPAGLRPRYAANLESAGYEGVEVTASGVAYLITSSMDHEGRTLTESDAGGVIRYEPHDCFRTLGECRFTSIGPDGRETHYLRTSRFSEGVWTDRLARDPARDPEGRSDLLEETRYSVDAAGVTYTMEKTVRRDGDLRVTRLARLSPRMEVSAAPAGQEDRAAPAAPRPSAPQGRRGAALPAGHHVTFEAECKAGEATLESGHRRWRIEPGAAMVIPAHDIDWRLRCQDGGFAATSCWYPGHVLVTWTDGIVRLGCYRGRPPSDPWAAR